MQIESISLFAFVNKIQMQNTAQRHSSNELYIEVP